MNQPFSSWLHSSALSILILLQSERGTLVLSSNHPFSMRGNNFVDEAMVVAAADLCWNQGSTN